MNIPLSGPDITEREVQAVAAVLRSPQLSLGPKLLEFERHFARYLDLPHAIAVSSGTAGLHLCIRALGIGEGDEVIVPSFTFIAAANVIRYERAIPVFVDIDPFTLNIDPARVEFAEFQTREKYLETYHRIDLGLDTFPYNGHTTSLDSFWMGVPVITRVGQTCVGRGGLSQLFQLDLLELAAESNEAFTSAAVALANDLPRLAALRQQLRPRLQRCPLMDAKRFAQNIESAYRQTWQNYLATSSG